MIKKYRILLLFLLAFFAFNCKEPFDQQILTGSTNYLVVDGIINPAGPTTVYLSRSLELLDTAAAKNELKALVQIEGESSGIFPLPEKGNGLYSIGQLNLNNNQKYRLRIKTSAGKEYLSDYVPVKKSPLIDSVNWVRDTKGVHIYATSHDTKKETRYYRWDYEETWEIHSAAHSDYKVRYSASNEYNGLAPITPGYRDSLYTCWRNEKSGSILIGSTAKLNDDVIYQAPIQGIPNGSDRLGVKYSILVKQYAISPEAYEYLSLMKKNSEQKGSFFDSQPTEIKGNIHSITDVDEPVIGFFQISSATEKRIFIEASQLLKWNVDLVCPESPLVLDDPLHPIDLATYFQKLYGTVLPTYAPRTSLSGKILELNIMPKQCVDCRLRGGNNDKPAFW